MTHDELLRNSEYFKGLSESGRRALAGICVRQAAGKGDYLFYEGEKAKAVYLLESGAVQLVKTSEDGREVVIKTVEAGEVFAEAILYLPAYPVTANVIRKSVVHRILLADFKALLSDSNFRTDFETGLMKRVHYLAGRISYLALFDVEERFFAFLRDRYGERDEYTVALSKKAIAAEIGTTPETLSRLVQRLEGAKKLSWKGKTIRLKRDFRRKRGTAGEGR